MLDPNTEVFLQSPHETKSNTLHVGQIVSQDGATVTALLRDPSFVPSPGDELLIYYMSSREFMQQSVVGTEAPVDDDGQPIEIEIPDLSFDGASGYGWDGETGPAVHFVTCGEPSSAENRQCYRASTALSERTATVHDQIDCPLLDVSATGFSVFSHTEHPIGKIIDASLTQDGVSYSGQACIQSARQMDASTWRYGLHCIEKRDSENSLEKGVRKINMAVQREQARRQSRAA